MGLFLLETQKKHRHLYISEKKFITFHFVTDVCDKKIEVYYEESCLQEAAACRQEQSNRQLCRGMPDK